MSCPDHPEATVHSLLGDYYCLKCDWWDIPLADDSRRA